MFRIYNLLTSIYHVDKITFHGYRTARPEFILATFDRNNEQIQHLEKILYEITKETRDNLVVFEVKKGNKEFTLMFSDNNMILGLGIIEERW